MSSFFFQHFGSQIQLPILKSYWHNFIKICKRCLKVTSPTFPSTNIQYTNSSVLSQSDVEKNFPEIIKRNDYLSTRKYFITALSPDNNAKRNGFLRTLRAIVTQWTATSSHENCNFVDDRCL